MRFLFVLGSRGEWGYIKPVIDQAIQKGHSCEIWACNMSVLPDYGLLAEEVSNSGYEIIYRSLTAVAGDSAASLTRSFGLTALTAADFVSNNSYDWVICAGDRLEQLAVVTVAFGQGLPIAHIQAGERSGNIDGMTRHAIARFTHLHFASNEDAANRLMRSGESSHRVHITGAPQLDEIRMQLPSRDELNERKISPKESFVMCVIHGVTEFRNESFLSEAQVLLEVLTEQPLPVVWIGSNNDLDGLRLRNLVTQRLRLHDKYFVNLNRIDYLGLLRDCEYLIGNSSSGILEAPSFGIPVINLGTRQRERVRSTNVIDVEFHRDSILEAMRRVQSPEFREIAKKAKNPYGDGESSRFIIELLEETKVSPEFLTKQIEY